MSTNRRLHQSSSQRDDPPAQPTSLRRRIVRLPSLTTTFVGREDEIAAGLAILACPETRLLTLTGPGGVGKTRLALAIAGNSGDLFPDGVVFVPLAPIHDPALVLPTIAQRLTMPNQADRTPASGLTMSLQQRRILLLLDNIDQIVGVGPTLQRLLRDCPDLTLLVTSRVPLRIDDERVFSVPALVPPKTDHASHDQVARHAAVELFIDRARAILPGVALSDEQRLTIAEICRRLDGLPLSIELAAVRLRSLTPAEMLRQLDHRLALLQHAEAIGSDRRLTVSDTIAWSLDMLDPPARLLFRRLAVFNGGFTPETAGVLCADLGADDDPTIAGLLETGLLRRVALPGEPPRLRLLETVREAALELLASSGESEEARRWHAKHYTDLAIAAEFELVGSEQLEWFDRLEREHDNLRAALAWARDRGDADTCMAICAGLSRFWERRGHVREARVLLEQIVALPSGLQPSRVRASALFGLGRMQYLQGDFTAAESTFNALRRVADEIDHDGWRAAAFTQLAHLATREGDYFSARSLIENGLALRRALGDQWGAGISLLVLGRNAHLLGDDDRAARLVEEAIGIFSVVGDRHSIAAGYNDLGEFALKRGRYSLARGHLEEALALHQELGDDMAVADTFILLGYVAIGQRNFAGARTLFTRSLTRLIDLGARWRVDPALDGLAEVAIATGAPEAGVRMLAVADRMRSELGTTLSPDARDRNENVTAAARAALGKRRFAAAWNAGQTISIDAISADILRTAGQPSMTR